MNEFSVHCVLTILCRFLILCSLCLLLPHTLFLPLIAVVVVLHYITKMSKWHESFRDASLTMKWNDGHGTMVDYFKTLLQPTGGSYEIQSFRNCTWHFPRSLSLNDAESCFWYSPKSLTVFLRIEKSIWAEPRLVIGKWKILLENFLLFPGNLKALCNLASQQHLERKKTTMVSYEKQS